MLKILLEDFVEEIKAEMYGYEEIEEDEINIWFENFERFVKDKKDKRNIIRYKGEEISINLKDESDLFSIVDKYLAAIENDELDKYFESFSL